MVTGCLQMAMTAGGSSDSEHEASGTTIFCASLDSNKLRQFPDGPQVSDSEGTALFS